MRRIEPPHPGILVRQQCLTPNHLGVVDAARILGVSRQALSNLVTGRAGISPEMAVRLAKAFGGTNEHWMQLQLAYDLAEVRKCADGIQVNPLASAHSVSAVTQ
jgi:antitoxin HigA-1